VRQFFRIGLAVAVISTALGVMVRPATASHVSAGYWMLTSDGHVYGFGGAKHFGDTVLAPNTRVDIEPSPSGHGYWILSNAGSVYTFGDARFHGSGPFLGLGEQYVSLSSTPSGDGYWLFTDRGRAFAYGAATHVGDMSAVRLNGPVLDSVATPTGRGYYMVANDGGVFTFGDARFQGSMGGTPLNKPVMSLAPDVDGTGYWLVASDGGIFAFEAPFYGSMGHVRLNRPVSGMVAQAGGYLMVAEDGGIFTFGDVQFFGSTGSNPPATPVVAVAPLGPGGEYEWRQVTAAEGTTDADSAVFELTARVARLNFNCRVTGEWGYGCSFVVREYDTGRQVDYVAPEANQSGTKLFYPERDARYFVEVSEYNDATQWSFTVEQEACVRHCG
jgi:hypothetical protein